MALVKASPRRQSANDGGGSAGWCAAAQRPSVCVDDDGSADPVDAAFLARAVTGSDEHPVDGGVGLYPDNVGGSLTFRA
jgi:hypothetical protein